ncbi:transcription-repair coupling factor [Klebsiella oxytoca]|nr:transcription-repair coupling factor [Klebsiella oxytoca]
MNTRLSFYKRIASAKSENELEEIKVELIDRFGLLPDPARNLLDIARLRQQAQKLGIRKLESNEKGGTIEFNEKNNVNPMWADWPAAEAAAALSTGWPDAPQIYAGPRRA